MIATFSYKQKFVEQNTEDSSPRDDAQSKRRGEQQQKQQQQHHHAYNLQVGYCHS
jgi:hypothetical protein